jgi:hypothetical protein
MEFDDPMYAARLGSPHMVAGFVYDSLGGCWDLPRSDVRIVCDPSRFTLPPEVFKRRPPKAP